MKARIHYTINGEEGSIVLEGDTVEDIREQAEREIARRGATDPWSEEL